MAGSNTELALEAAANIAKLHTTFAKSARMINKFKTYLKDADTSKLSAKGQAQLKDLQESLLPAFEKSKITKKEAASSMECAHEFLKAQPKDKSVVDMVCQSLKKDKKSHTKVRIAEKMHKRMLKCKADAKAKSFWTEAKALYP